MASVSYESPPANMMHVPSTLATPGIVYGWLPGCFFFFIFSSNRLAADAMCSRSGHGHAEMDKAVKLDVLRLIGMLEDISDHIDHCKTVCLGV